MKNKNNQFLFRRICMFYSYTKHIKKLLITVIGIFIICLNVANASLNDYIERFQTIRVTKQLPDSDEDNQRGKILSTLFATPDISVINLANTDINDDDSDVYDIALGLSKRQNDPRGLRFLNLSDLRVKNDKKFTEKGLHYLLGLFEKGFPKGKSENPTSVEYPAVRQLQIKVSQGIPLEDGILKNWRKEFPRTAASGVTITQ